MKKLILGALLAVSAGTYAQGLQGIVAEKYYVSNVNDSIVSAQQGGGNLPVGSVTWRFYADLATGYKLKAVYGVDVAPTGVVSSGDHELKIMSTAPIFNNEDRGGVSPTYTKAQTASNSVMLDSWLSMGAGCSGHFGIEKSSDNGVSTTVNANGMLQNNDASAGIPLTAQDGLISGSPSAVSIVGLSQVQIDVFNNVSGFGSSLVTSNGSWASLAGIQGPNSDNKVLFLQITTRGTVSYTFNLQLATPSGGVERWVASSPVGNEFTHPSLTGSVAPATLSGPDTVCASASNTFTVLGSGATGFTWSASPSTGVTISGTAQNTKTVKFTNSGSYVLTIVPNNGSPSVSKAVFVRALPTGGTISPSTVQCANSNVACTIAGAINTTSYSWSVSAGGNIVSQNGTNATVSIGNAGNYTVSVALSNNGCAATALRTRVLTAVSPASGGSITGASTVCQGSAGTYGVSGVANTTTATTYTWAAGNGATLSGSGASRTLTFVNSGVTTITVTPVTGSCTGSPITLNVTVNPTPAKPVISGGATFCSGTSTTFSVGQVLGVANTWSLTPNTGTILSGQGSSSVNVSWNGTYTSASTPATLSVVSSFNACSSQVVTKAVTINKQPNPATLTTSLDSACSGISVNATATSAFASTYTWTVQYAASAGTGTGSTRTFTMGTRAVNVSVTPKNGTCAGVIASKTVVLETVPCGSKMGEMSGSDDAQFSLDFFPVPVSNDYSVSVSGLAEDKNFTLSWYTIDGRKVFSDFNFISGTGTIVKGYTGQLASGTYFIKVQTDDKVFLKQIIVE